METSYLLDLELANVDEGLSVDIHKVLKRVAEGSFPGATKDQLLTLAEESAATLATQHPDYSYLAARINLQHLYSKTDSNFSDFVTNYDAATQRRGKLPKMHDEFLAVVKTHKAAIDAQIVTERDKSFTIFGLKTILTSYCLSVDGKVVERPQYLFMRAALGIHLGNLDAAFKTYHLMSQKYFVHATPTLFHSGLVNGQLSSCFLAAVQDDSIEGIFSTLSDCARISKFAGGIGLHVSNVRAKDAKIAGSSGSASGLVPMLRVFNNMARYVSQGGNRRPGAISITLEPWHADIFDFINLRKNHGKEEYRARDLFYALWVPDLFMQKVEADGDWYLFSPDEAPGLNDVFGAEFEALYANYVDQKLYRKKVRAQMLWNAIMDAQIETGNPSILYKDACNAKSNQTALGTIKSSNLCTEIVQYSSAEETAVCNLASIGLAAFVEAGQFRFDKLAEVTAQVTANLDVVIDRTFYPTESARRSNLNHRPMAIGVQGLADVFMKLRMPFDSEEAAALNTRIFETIYYAALETSCDRAKDLGRYESFENSPSSKGQLQFDLWGTKSEVRREDLDWDGLKAKISVFGLRNSLFTAIMPTASTSQILGYNECIEPITSNIYSRRVLSGEFQVVNSFLVNDLETLGLWNDHMRARIIANHGSVQGIPEIPGELQDLYRTVWEIKQKTIIDLCAARGPFIDQSQSMNIYLQSPSRKQMSSMHFYGWRKGLKTGLYYLRSRAAAAPTQFTIDPSISVAKAKSDGTSESSEKTVHQSKRPRFEECNVCSA